jgi:hypothetical protein
VRVSGSAAGLVESIPEISAERPSLVLVFVPTAGPDVTPSVRQIRHSPWGNP